MKIITSILIPFIAIFFCNSTSCIITKRKFGEILPITFMMTILVEYFSQLVFNTFLIGNIILLIYSLFSLIYLIIKKFEKKYTNNIFTIGFYTYTAFYIFFTIIYFKKFFNLHDELMHWGPMVKEMLRLDSFYTEDVSSLMYHKDYPPFMSLFEMLWCKVSGNYSEMNVTTALHVFMVSLVITPLVEKLKLSKKNFINSICIGGIAIFIVLFTDVYHTFSSIYLDITLPLIFAYSMYLILCEKQSRYSYIGILLSCITMVMTKQSGIAFFAVSALTFLLKTVLINDENKKDKKAICNKIILLMLLISIPLLVNKSWSIYVSKFDVYQQFKLSDIKISDLKNITSEGNYQREVVKKFYNAIIDTNISSCFLKITYFSSFFFTLIFLVIIWNCILKKINNHSNKRTILIFGISLFIGTIGYMCMMLLLYLFSFSQKEATNLASFDRYMSSYFVGELISVFMFGMKFILDKTENNGLTKKLLIVLFACPIIINSAAIKDILPQVLKGNNYEKYVTYGNYLNDNTEENSKILVISFKTTNMQLYTHYFTDARFFQLSWHDYLNCNYNNEKKSKELFDEIKVQDYIYIVDITENFNDHYLQYLQNAEQFEKNGLYKVTYNNEKLTISKK